jgi:putative flippase GtrA
VTTTEPQRPARRLPLSVVFGAAALLRLAFVAPLHAPMVFADEVAPTLFARALLDRHPTPTMAYEPFYHAGYAILSAPWTALFGPIGAWHATTVMNAVLLAAIVPLVFLLLRDSLDVPPSLALAAAAVTSLYPSFLLEAGFTWSESAVVTVVLLTYVACQRMMRAPTTWRAVAFGAAAASAYLVHARLLPLLLLSPVALYLARRWHGLTTTGALAGLAASAVLFLATRVLHEWLRTTLYLGTPASDEKEVVTRIFRDPVNFLHALGSFAGQTWYLSVATFGLAPLGIALLVAELRRRPRRVDLLYVAAVTATLFIVSALFVIDPDRVDKRVYGRYAETSLAVLLAFGLVALARRRDIVERIGAMVAVPVLLGGALLFGVGREHFRGAVIHSNILGIDHFVLDRPGVPVGHITLYATLVAAAVAGGHLLLRRRGTAIVFVVVGALFLGAAVRTHQDVLGPVRLAHDVTDSVPDALPRIEALTGLRIDDIDVVYFPKRNKNALFGYQFRLPDVAFHVLDARAVPTRPWVMAPVTWPAGPRLGARPVYPEGIYDAALWVMPGREQDRLVRAGIVATAAVLPDEGLRATVTPEQRSLVLPRGDEGSLRVELEHRGTGSWPAWYEHGVIGGRVHVRAEWRRAGAEEIVWQNDAELPRRLLPGETVDVAMPVMTRGATGAMPPAGTYELVFVVVQEGRTPVRAAGPPVTLRLR